MEVDNPTPKGGYNPKMFNNQHAIENYICTICSNVLREAVQIPQSADPKRACHDCYNSNIRYAYTFLLVKRSQHAKVYLQCKWFAYFRKFHYALQKSGYNPGQNILEKLKKNQVKLDKSRNLWCLLLSNFLSFIAKISFLEGSLGLSLSLHHILRFF